MNYIYFSLMTQDVLNGVDAKKYDFTETCKAYAVQCYANLLAKFPDSEVEFALLNGVSGVTPYPNKTKFNNETDCPEIEQINEVLLDVWGLGEFYVKKNSKSPKVFVHGSRSNMWHLVEKNDRDYSYGISQQDFIENGVDWAYNKYYKPIQLR
jgi:hypothetical protein